VRATQLQVRAADRRHPRKVVRPGQEGGEGRRERLPAPPLHRHGGGDHLLLGDVHLEVAVTVRVPEELAVGRVGHLAVQRHHVAAHVAEGLQRLAVRLAGRDLVARRVARQLAAGRGLEAVPAPVILGRCQAHPQIA
jgi:hypothetical protein